MKDLISRQAAIDEAEEWIEAIYCERTEQRERDAIKHVINGIKKLSSAQPEIIYCWECKYHDKGSNESDSWNLCGYRPWQYVKTDDEHYCGYAERRTDVE